MQGKHWLFFSGCLVSIASMMAAMHDWSEAQKPAFIAGVLGVIGSHLAAMYTTKPGE